MSVNICIEDRGTLPTIVFSGIPKIKDFQESVGFFGR